MWILSLFFLYSVALACIVGALAPAYHDNPLQRIGMALVCLGCISRANYYADTHVVHFDALIFQFGMFLFAAGTYCKVQIAIIREKARRFTSWPHVERRRNHDHVGTAD